MNQGHSREEVLTAIRGAEVAAVATAAGERMRARMMHFAVDDNFDIYLATMKGDPKTMQITHHPSISLLVHRPGENINESSEVEITGAAQIISDPALRQKALEMTAPRSPVVGYLSQTGNTGILDCLKVSPETIKYRVFKEIVQGMPPTVLEFPQNRLETSDWSLLKRKARNWWLALRFAFLTATIVPILLGTAVGWLHAGAMNWVFFALALVAGLGLHASANILNDYFDHRSGNDEANREFVRPFSGGSRVIQSGLLTPLEVLMGGVFFLLLSGGIGAALIWHMGWSLGWPILALGGVGAVSGFFYTGRPFYWARRGIGETLVGLNFGPLMALGAYYVQALSFSWVPVVAALPVALLIAAVLYINEFPDYSADKAVGKDTLVVRLGRARAVYLYALMMAGVYVALAAGVIAGTLPLVALIGLGTLPIAARAILYAWKHHSRSFDLVPANALTITCHLATGLLITLAYIWDGLGAEGAGYIVLLGALFAGFVAYMYRHVEHQKNIFLGLKKVVQ